LLSENLRKSYHALTAKVEKDENFLQSWISFVRKLTMACNHFLARTKEYIAARRDIKKDYFLF